MKARFFISVLLLSIGLAGCPTPQPTPTVIDTKGLTESVTKLEGISKKLEEANKKVDEIKRKSLSKASAAVKGMLRANEEVPEGNPKATIKAEGQIATDRLPEADREDLLEMTQRVMLMLQGKYEEAKGHYAAAAADLTAAKMSLAAAEKERDIMKLDKDAAILKAKGEVEDIRVRSKVNEDGMRAAFEIKEREKDGEIRRLGRQSASSDWALYAKWFAGITAGLIAYSIFRKDPETAACAGGTTLAAIFCTSMSIFVGSEIYMVASIIGGSVLFVALIGIIIYIFTRKKKEVKIESDQSAANDALKEMVKAFEKAKVSAPDKAKEISEFFKDEMGPKSKEHIAKLISSTEIK